MKQCSCPKSEQQSALPPGFCPVVFVSLVVGRRMVFVLASVFTIGFHIAYINSCIVIKLKLKLNNNRRRKMLIRKKLQEENQDFKLFTSVSKEWMLDKLQNTQLDFYIIKGFLVKFIAYMRLILNYVSIFHTLNISILCLRT